MFLNPINIVDSLIESVGMQQINEKLVKLGVMFINIFIALVKEIDTIVRQGGGKI